MGEVQLLLGHPRALEAACKMASKRCQQCSCVHRRNGRQQRAEAEVCTGSAEAWVLYECMCVGSQVGVPGLQP